MILNKNIDIKISPKNNKFLLENGYKGKNGDIISIKIEHLSKYSKIKIEVICINCNNIGLSSYNNYCKITNNNINDYYCKNCKSVKSKITCNDRYGVDSPMKLQSIKDKLRKSTLDKYGVENVFQSNIIKDKIKKTNLEKYGVESFTKTSYYLEKTKKTKFDRYNNYNYNNIDKIKKTNLEKYGVESYLSYILFDINREKYYKDNKDLIKENLKLSNLEKYGVENVFELEDVKDKIKKTNLEKYGVNHTMKLDSIKDKIKKTNLDRYGVDNPSKSKEILKKKSLTSQRNLIKKYNIIDIIDNTYLKLSCDNGHVYQIDKSLFYNRLRLKTIICTECHPLNSFSNSGKEIDIRNFITNNYKDSMEFSNRKILKGKEIDIYLPDLNLAFEFNGLYWHSEIYKDKNYHLDKTKKCSESGIQLIHIWEDDWVYKKDIVKSIILNKLGENTNKIYARKCQIKEINDNKIIRSFLEKNHIQGFVGSKIKLGLYYNNELVSLMTFGNLRKNLGQKSKEGSYELLRFCNALNTSVIGGASKLFKYFIKNYDFKEIISYSDNSRSNGNLYKILGFENINETINYYWTKNDIRYHRFNFRKDKLVKKGYDPNKTEIQIMSDLGYIRIFDSGTKKWIYK
jgi:hypothetical protein